MQTVAPTPEDVQRLKAVFQEIPGTRLTADDASRLSGLDRSTCRSVLTALEAAQFLKCGRDGLYQQRRTDSPNS